MKKEIKNLTNEEIKELILRNSKFHHDKTKLPEISITGILNELKISVNGKYTADMREKLLETIPGFRDTFGREYFATSPASILNNKENTNTFSPPKEEIHRALENVEVLNNKKLTLKFSEKVTLENLNEIRDIIMNKLNISIYASIKFSKKHTDQINNWYLITFSW